VVDSEREKTTSERMRAKGREGERKRGRARGTEGERRGRTVARITNGERSPMAASTTGERWRGRSREVRG